MGNLKDIPIDLVTGIKLKGALLFFKSCKVLGVEFLSKLKGFPWFPALSLSVSTISTILLSYSFYRISKGKNLEQLTTKNKEKAKKSKNIS